MLTHKGTITIQTERLLLRKFRPNDAQDMYDTWGTDERVTPYVTWDPHESVDFTKQLVEDWCSSYERPNFYLWAIEFDGKLIGSISVGRIKERNESVELGYCIGYDFWNKGFMTEATKAVMDFLFAEVGVHRIGISHVVQNPASGRVAQKCGLTYEGTRRESFKMPNGEFLDIADYGILRSEWKK